MTLNSRGLGLIEILLSSAIMIMVVLVISSVIAVMFSANIKLTDKEFFRLEMENAMHYFTRRLFNVAVIRPIEVLSSGHTYRGLAGVTNEGPASSCSYQLDGQGEKYSVARFSTIGQYMRPEESLEKWSEGDIALSKPLRISYHPDLSEGYHVFQNGDPQNTSEILLIDADSVDIRRYKVASVATVAPGVTIPEAHLALDLEMPRDFEGNVQLAGSSDFVSKSIIYPLSTRYICVDSNSGDLVETEEGTGNAKTVLSIGNREPASIERFEMRYLDSQDSERLARGDFFPYPYDDSSLQHCLTAVLLRLEISTKYRESVTLEKVVLINNFNIHRAKSCGVASLGVHQNYRIALFKGLSIF